MSSISESVGNYAHYPDLQGKRLLVTGESTGMLRMHVAHGVLSIATRIRQLPIPMLAAASTASTVSCYLLTGSSSGIGKAVALAFASQTPGNSSAPARICITSRSTSRLKPVVTLIQSQGAEAFCVAGDLTKPDDCRRIVEYAVT